jgi:Ran GTPase-activating protein (RanGAP) involved in mRNA processing and transport
MLVLKNYNINKNTCEALAHALQKDSRLLTELFIDDCGLSDELLAMLLEGVGTQPLQYLTLKNSVTGLQSMDRICSLLDKTFPNQVRELTVVNCMLSPACQRELLGHLRTGFQTLNKLALVKVGLTAESLDAVGVFLKEHNRQMKQLDLSYAGQKPGAYGGLLEVLGEKQTIIDDIVLTGNQLQTTAEETALALRAVLENPNLVHVNLSDTGLSFKAFRYLTPAIKQSTSLIGLHLSDNPMCFDDRLDDELEFCEKQVHLGVHFDFEEPALGEDEEGGESLSHLSRERMRIR